MGIRWRPRGLTLVSIMLALLTAGVRAQVTTTQVVDTVYRANGTPASGTVLVSWGAFTTASGASVPAGSTSATLDAGGVLHLNLAPNAGATPVGTYYTAVYHLDDGRTSREYWVVPVSTNPVTIAAVRNSVLPVSVAMQSVSKQYVDQAIASAVSGAPLGSTPYVLKAGDTMTGALTLQGDPDVANQASNKHYVDAQISSVSVQKSGDTMTGPLVLPSDPVSSLQAADKHYVDAQITSVNTVVGQKISAAPTATQTIVQPAGTMFQVAKNTTSSTQAVAAVGDNVAFATNANTAKMTVTSTNSDSNVLLGQDATHGILFAWSYSATAANAYGVLETYAGNNPLILQRSGNRVGIGTTSPTQLLSVGTSSQFTVDASGNVTAANLRPILVGVTGSIGGSALAVGACASGTVSVAGATVGAPVVTSASDGSLPNALVMLSAAVTGAGTVTVQECAVASVTPVAKTFNVRVIQ